MAFLDVVWTMRKLLVLVWLGENGCVYGSGSGVGLGLASRSNMVWEMVGK